MKDNYRLTAELKQEIRRLYDEPQSAARVAQAVGFSRPAVINALRQMGVEIRPHGNPSASSKFCPDCCQEKPAADFYRSYRNGAPAYLDNKCKKCRYIAAAQWKKENPEKLKQSKSKYYRNNVERYRENARSLHKRHPEKSKAKSHKRRTRAIAAGENFTAEEWAALLIRYGSACLCCGNKQSVELDHIIPISKPGASNRIHNLQPLCKSCNSRKCDRTIDYRPDKSSLIPRD